MQTFVAILNFPRAIVQPIDLPNDSMRMYGAEKGNQLKMKKKKEKNVHKISQLNHKHTVNCASDLVVLFYAHKHLQYARVLNAVFTFSSSH